MANCVYIHIPFCEKKCNYCAFCSFELLNKKEEYLRALEKEISLFYKGEKLKTLYFGGGTPSLLCGDEVGRILKYFSLDDDCEVTLELNPHSINYEKLKVFKDLGINRFSIGVQSFDDKILKNIGRLHAKKDILNTIDDIKKLEIDNFSIDLIYGLPAQTLKNWVETLDIALKLNPAHISFYGLKIEKGTKFYKFPPKNLPSSDEQARMYEIGIEMLDKKYIHYEFSNFARCEKYFSKHNLTYWHRGQYYGFGLGASGFLNKARYTNTLNYKKYVDFFLNNNVSKIRTFQNLDLKEEVEEEIFLNLRTFEGLNLDNVYEKYGIDIYLKYKKIFDKFIKDKFLIKTFENGKNIIRFSKSGILVSNEILCEFIDV